MTVAPATPSVSVTDNGAIVEVAVPLPEGVGEGEARISGGADYLNVHIAGAEQPLLSVLQLYGTVDPDRTTSQTEGGKLLVRLHKLDPRRVWPGLEAVDAPPHEPSLEEDSVRPSAAMRERDRVRQLLQAAQAGDTTAFEAAAVQFGQGGVRAVRDGNGRNALHFAAQVGQNEMCTTLLAAHGLPVDAQDEHGVTALALAAAAGLQGTVHLLLSFGGDPNLRHPGGGGPLHRACTTGNVDVVEALLEAGADVEAAAGAGPPLLWAAGSSAAGAGVVRALLTAGAEVNARADGGVTALFMAAASGGEDAARALLEMGADPTAAIEGGATPLHSAAEAGNLPIVEALLQAGADPSAVDQVGARALEAAAEGNSVPMVEKLLPLTAAPPGWSAPWTAAAVMDEARSAAAGAASSGGGSGGDSAAQEIPPKVEVPQPENEDQAAAAEAKAEGDACYRAGSHQAAVEAYTRSLHNSTRDARVWANRSAAHLAAGDAAAAASDARVARTVDPAYAKAWYREGAASSALLQWEPAAQAFYEAYRLEPANDDVAAAFQRAIASGQQAHTQQQQQQQQQQQR